jgi:hypothetical protein
MNGSGGIEGYSSTITLVGCDIIDNKSYSEGPDDPQIGFTRGGGVGCTMGSLTAVGCTFAGNYSEGPGAAIYLSNAELSITGCTFVDNWCYEDQIGSVIGTLSGYDGVIENSILAFNAGQAIDCSAVGDISLICCDLYGNGADWIDCIADQAGTNANFSADPRFCDYDNGNYEIDTYSPCAPSPGCSPCGQIVGAHYIGCETVIDCGDADASGEVDIDDAVYLSSYIFAGGPGPCPYESGDLDCSGGVDIDDVVWLVAFIFSGGNAPCDTDGDGVPDC